MTSELDYHRQRLDFNPILLMRLVSNLVTSDEVHARNWLDRKLISEFIMVSRSGAPLGILEQPAVNLAPHHKDESL